MFCYIGLRGNAPIISLGGNSITVYGHWTLIDIGYKDIRWHDHWRPIMRMRWSFRVYWYTMMKSTIYGILSEGVVWWPTGLEGGGGGSGIGGIKSTMEIHEFCIVRSLKLCSFLGCKWGVPLVIGGGVSSILGHLGHHGHLGHFDHFGHHVV